MTNQKKNKVLICATIFLCILLILDQLSKIIVAKNNINITIIENILAINTVHNTGGAFGIATGNTVMFVIANVIVLGLIIRFIYVQREFMDKITLFSLFTILAGGFGNLIDRITRGYVVDFINIIPNINFPKFNLADIYITIGWIILAFTFALFSYKEIKKGKKIKE